MSDYPFGWYVIADKSGVLRKQAALCPGCAALTEARGEPIRFSEPPDSKHFECRECGALYGATTVDEAVLLAILESFERTEAVMRESARDATGRGHGESAIHCMGLAEGLAIAAIALRGVLAEPPSSPNGSINSPELKVVS